MKFIVALGLVMLWYVLMLVWVNVDDAIRRHENEARDGDQ